jgi:hypothetical protein
MQCRRGRLFRINPKAQQARHPGCWPAIHRGCSCSIPSGRKRRRRRRFRFGSAGRARRLDRCRKRTSPARCNRRRRPDRTPRRRRPRCRSSLGRRDSKFRPSSNHWDNSPGSRCTLHPRTTDPYCIPRTAYSPFRRQQCCPSWLERTSCSRNSHSDTRWACTGTGHRCRTAPAGRRRRCRTGTDRERIDPSRSPQSRPGWHRSDSLRSNNCLRSSGRMTCKWDHFRSSRSSRRSRR